MKYNWNNYHTHTFRCKHAEKDAADYARRAAELGMTRLGMSDHAYSPGEVSHPTHMDFDMAEDYVRACREADGLCGVRVLCGLECDFAPEDVSFFKEYYLGELGMDYLIGSVHGLKNHPELLNPFSPQPFGIQELRLYTDLYVGLIESGIFTFGGHPDLFGRPLEVSENHMGWTPEAASCSREIVDAAKAHNLPLEINTSGYARSRERNIPFAIFPRREFWEIAADAGIRVLINTDAHSVVNLDADIEPAFALVKELGLKRVELGDDGKPAEAAQ